MADALVRAGAQVAVTGRDRARAEVVAAELGDGATGFALDVRDPATVRDGVDAVADRFGGIDLLVCNAGIGQRTVNPNFLTDPEPFWTAAPDAFGTSSRRRSWAPSSSRARSCRGCSRWAAAGWS